MTQIFTFHITASLDVTALLPIRARNVEGAQRRMERIDAKKAADALTTSYGLNRIETGIGCSVGDAIAEEVPRVVFPRTRAALLDFPAFEYRDQKEGCVELTGDGLATKSYPIAAATNSEALAKFFNLDAAQLNATPWQVWGVTFYDDVELTLGGNVYALRVDEETLEAIAEHIELEL
ncbi:hypothetical protein FIU09_01715 [Stenotrophomonas maltophilia]|uniref:hypothetical protein n=1 Tax=Stenotrophomonas TaxID=40323 RepID=UPI0011220CE8|nr:hypothetical protein FIU09_01715 [Stenotrophomonas maltophilia]TPD81615.1 hypothetical protein FJN21_00510 [Stenotrophomonas maltophilia]TPD83120.1 hypothetical protein FJN20_09315 [Stenotrophomonas maltophilia]TPD86612.1 hypothetical protein FJN19_03155 [Stenotrophomonas maltophilia]HDS1088181.1 hypothetical protein [Stenotrophomonas maltophilia]